MKKLGVIILSYMMVLGLFAMPVKSVDKTVASTGGKTYTTLMDAANAVSKGGIVVLESSIEITSTTRLILTGEKYDFTLDLNGNKITQELVKNNIGDTPAPIRLEGSKLTVKDSKGGGEIFGHQTPVLVLTNASFTLENGSLRGHWFGLSGNGLWHGTQINIKGGTISNEHPEGIGAAIYHPQTGKLSISGGVIQGEVGVQLCAGEATVFDMSGGKIEGTGRDLRKDKTGDGVIPDGAAISVVNRKGYDSVPKLNIMGGSFVSAQTQAVLAYAWNGNFSNMTEWAGAKDNVKINGGTFNTTPEKLVVDSHKVYSVDGKFQVAPKTDTVSLNKASLALDVAKSETLVAKLDPVGAIDPITWTSSNTKVATVDATGKVTAIAEGTTTITAIAGGKTATCIVTVNEVKKPTVEVPTIDTTTPPKEVIVGVQDKASQEVVADTVNSILGNITSGKEVSKEVVSQKTLQAVKEAIDAGKEVTPKVEAKTIDVKTVDKTIVNKVDELVEKFSKVNETKATVAQYLDLGVLLMADAKELGTVNQLDKAIEFTVALPTDLMKEGRVFYVVRIHNGVAEKLTTTMNEDGTLTFETDKFSTYAIVYEEGTITEKTPGKGDTVKTSDNNQTMLYASFGALAVVGAGLVLMLKKREELSK